MNVRKVVLVLAAASAAVAPCLAASWEITAAASYGVCFLQGAPYGYHDEKPDARTNEPVGARVDVAAGRWGGEFLYMQRYESYPEIGKTHDLSLTFRGAPLAAESWGLFAVAGLSVSEAPAGLAFYHFGPGPYYYWTPVAGAEARWRPTGWLDVAAAADFRYRPQTIDFFRYDHSYGTVKSPAVTASARASFTPWLGLSLGPRLEYITYGPYDYYLYGKTNRSVPWESGHEFYVMAEVGWRLAFD